MEIEKLKAGDILNYSGTIYTARDAAHKRLVEMLESGAELPIDINGIIVYYAGPCPAKPGKVIGPVGPTTSGRMDAYSPFLIERGMKIMIGKGQRSKEVIDAIKKHIGVYLTAIGGAAAVLADCVVEAEVVAFEDLGPEAIRKLTVKDFPLIVTIDSQGNNLYDTGYLEYTEK